MKIKFSMNVIKLKIEYQKASSKRQLLGVKVSSYFKQDNAYLNLI